MHSPIRTNALLHKINTKKTKARFSRLQRHPALKWRGLILVSVLHKSVTYLLSLTLTHLLTAPDPHRAGGQVHIQQVS